MTTVKETSDDDDAKERILEETIGKFRSVKKELFELSRPIDEVLQSITQSEQQRIDEVDRLKHVREQQQQTAQRLIEVVTELQCLKSENETLKYEREEHKETFQRLMEVESELQCLKSENESMKQERVEQEQTVQRLMEVESELKRENEALRHDREEQQQTVQRLTEVETELKRENEALKHERVEQQQTVQRLIGVESELQTVMSENIKLSDTISKQKLSLVPTVPRCTGQLWTATCPQRHL